MSEQYLDRGDAEMAAQLLHIVEKCAGHSGKLGSLSNAAMSALLKINDNIKVRAMDEAKAKAEEDAANQAAVAEQHEDVDTTDDRLKPSTHPQGSRTATIADDNARRV